MSPTETIALPPGRRIYFASDFHLGSWPLADSQARERLVVAWLDSIRTDAEVIFLVGDVFDFWFEYHHAIPKGFIRLQGKLAELTDAGLRIVLFTGNHDMWMSDYFSTELGIPVYRQPRSYLIDNKRFLVGHGDGLGPGDFTYKRLKQVFENPLARRLFQALHPDVGISLAQSWSRRSRASHGKRDEDEFRDAASEWLWQYCRETEQTDHHDFYIFGHRHLPLDLPVTAQNEGSASGMPPSRYINLGEWITNRTYAVFDGQDVQLNQFHANALSNSYAHRR